MKDNVVQVILIHISIVTMNLRFLKSYAEKVEIDEHWIRKIERVLEEKHK